jgi:hypothetical protein
MFDRMINVFMVVVAVFAIADTVRIIGEIARVVHA